MKFLSLPTLFCILFCSSTFAQEDVKAKHEAYYLCINTISQSPKQAYQFCSSYLQKYPDDDKRLTDYVQRWITAYLKISVYLNSIEKHLDSNETKDWIVYKPDLKKKIPIISDISGSHKIEIARHFTNSKEEKYLRIAESVYPNPKKFSDDLYKNWSYWSQSHTTPPENEFIWWTGYSDTILSTAVLTSSAVIYYFDISQKLKNNNNKIKENSFTFFDTNLKYDSSIKKFDKYERGGRNFTDVYVADMTLTWGQICGGLCGHGFTRNKVVVLDKNGTVLGMFLDAEVNRGGWVS